MDRDVDEGAPRLTSYGGKSTSYRHVAHQAGDELAAHVAALSGRRWTGKAPLPGGDFPTDGAAALTADIRLSHPFLPPATADRIVHAYGTDARAWLGQAQDWDTLGGEIAHGFPVAAVAWMVARAWARTRAGAMWRRRKLELVF